MTTMNVAPEQSHKTQTVLSLTGHRSEGETAEASPGEMAAPAVGAAEENEWINVQSEEEFVPEEVEPLRSAPAPKLPSAAEVEEHRLTHAQYRSWCKFCVMGRGLGERRGRHAGRAHAIPRIGIDYWYVTSDGLKSRRAGLPRDA